jgi:hypothetical protein
MGIYLAIFGVLFYHFTGYCSFWDQEKRIYLFEDDPIDVVIPSTPKDLEVLDACVEGIIANCARIRDVYVVSKTQLTPSARWFDEALYPFSKKDVAYHLAKKDPILADKILNEEFSRVGWYYQQLLKLYAPFAIPNISSNVLVLDSDTVFLKPVSFLNEENAGLYDPSSEYWMPYFYFSERLLPGFRRLYPQYSGISHHMLFQRPVLEDLFACIEEIHEMPFWQAFCAMVDVNQLSPFSSGASEYELYFNFVFHRTDQVEIRRLRRIDIPSLNKVAECIQNGYDYYSCHDWMRQ